MYTIVITKNGLLEKVKLYHKFSNALDSFINEAIICGAELPEDIDGKPFEEITRLIDEGTANLNYTISFVQKGADDEENEGIASIKWSYEDIIERAHDNDFFLTTEQAKEVLKTVIHEHDASIGINWEVIDYWINYYISEAKREGNTFDFRKRIRFTDLEEGETYRVQDLKNNVDFLFQIISIHKTGCNGERLDVSQFIPIRRENMDWDEANEAKPPQYIFRPVNEE